MLLPYLSYSAPKFLFFFLRFSPHILAYLCFFFLPNSAPTSGTAIQCRNLGDRQWRSLECNFASFCPNLTPQALTCRSHRCHLSPLSLRCSASMTSTLLCISQLFNTWRTLCLLRSISKRSDQRVIREEAPTCVVTITFRRAK